VPYINGQGNPTKTKIVLMSSSLCSYVKSVKRELQVTPNER
jgi:hypothetical protein